MVSLVLPQNAFRHMFRVGRASFFVNVINVLLVIWLAWQLAGLSWLVVSPPPHEPGDVPEPALQQPVQRRQNSVNAQQLANWHVFGEAGKQAVVKKATPLSAPETRLRLTLKGVFASDDKGLGQAIIADPKGKEDNYAVGDPLPGGARLSAIYPDRIILERSGRFETLKLPKKRNRTGSRAGGYRASNRAGVGNERVRAAAFNRYRKAIRQNPSSFLNYVRATPARQNGKFIGFRLQAGRQRGALRTLGLKPGDIVTAINGVKIDAPAKGMKAMQALGKGDSVSVTLLRGGQEVSLNLDLPETLR